jgi:two-component sensor histidine kinase
VNVPRAILGDVALCLYRIVREALQNSIKHASFILHAAPGRGTRIVVKVDLDLSPRAKELSSP